MNLNVLECELTMIEKEIDNRTNRYTDQNFQLKAMCLFLLKQLGMSTAGAKIGTYNKCVQNLELVGLKSEYLEFSKWYKQYLEAKTEVMNSGTN